MPLIFFPPYELYRGALSRCTGLTIAIKTSGFEFGLFSYEKQQRELCVVAHEVKLRMPMAEAKSFTSVNLHVNSKVAHKEGVQMRVMEMLDGLPPPVLLAADLNNMASQNRTVEKITAVMSQTRGAVQGLPSRSSEVELDEPCVVALYHRANSQSQ